MLMKIKKGRETVTNKIAYMAGFFDGEGCIRIKKSSQKGNSYHLICHITNSNWKILRIYQYYFGGQVRKQERTPNKTIYQYYVTCAEACDMLKTMLGFLREKREQANLGIDFHNMQGDFDVKMKEHHYKEMRRLKKC